MSPSPICAVVFDGSTQPATVILNGTRMALQDDEDARCVFDVLNRTRDLIGALDTLNMTLVAGLKGVLKKAGEL